MLAGRELEVQSSEIREVLARKLARPKGLGKKANQTTGSTDTEKDKNTTLRYNKCTYIYFYIYIYIEGERKRE